MRFNTQSEGNTINARFATLQLAFVLLPLLGIISVVAITNRAGA